MLLTLRLREVIHEAEQHEQRNHPYPGVVSRTVANRTKTECQLRVIFELLEVVEFAVGGEAQRSRQADAGNRPSEHRRSPGCLSWDGRMPRLGHPRQLPPASRPGKRVGKFCEVALPAITPCKPRPPISNFLATF